MFEACREGKSARVAELAEGFDGAVQGPNGRTALMAAVYDWNLDSVKALIPRGGLDVQDSAGDTALIAAARMQADEIAVELLAAGADPGLRDCSGMTALMCAMLEVRKGSDIVDRLCAVSDVNLKNRRGDSAAAMALKMPHGPTVERVFAAIAHKADLAQVDAAGRSLEELAESGGHARAASLIRARRERGALDEAAPSSRSLPSRSGSLKL